MIYFCQEANTKAIEPPPKEGGDRVSEADKEDNLQVVMGTAPPGKRQYLYRRESVDYISTSGNRDDDRIETLLHERKKGQGVEVLPRYLQAGISSFRLITTFLLWKETISRLEGWNPYKERTIAKTLAKIAKEKVEDKPPKTKSGLYKYTRANTPPKEPGKSIKEHLRQYRIPRQTTQFKKDSTRQAPPQSNNKRKRKYKPQPPKYKKNKPPNQPQAKKAKFAHQQMEMEEQEKWMQIADFARAFNGIKKILDK
ncbi:uncharacterized protein VP01_1947g1 [Puccinia sorghi]|uniref:Uncharacterized protein n=1 Tax=Puccinia sorghi TaxID=27349 RepID=A0A0L6VE23_9BASI|nr:uncharacterized protein VP01_1947g1 [Puccinia sorghi]